MKHQGFTLLEMSIVLLVMALLAGGIVAGENLIRQSELKSVLDQYQTINGAYWSFKNKYDAIPGDFPGATRVWGRLNGNADCVTGSGSAVAAPGTCDGNGDGTLQIASGANASGEMFQFWRQLALGGFLEGRYTGLAGPGGGLNSIVSSNIPESRISGAGWGVRWLGVFAGNGTSYAMDYGSVYDFGAESATTQPNNPVFTPEEAYGIDVKIDDGKPAYGMVIAYYWNNQCAAADDGSHANNDLQASYKLSEPATLCALIFRNQF